MDPLTADPDWMAEAACLEAPTSIFYPVAGDPDTAHWVAYFCDQCPVEEECLEYALARREPYGIWGGKTETERRRILRQRHGARPNMARVGRPRKNAS